MGSIPTRVTIMNMILIILIIYAVLVHIMWGVVCYRHISTQAWYSDSQTFWLSIFNALPIIIIFSMIHSAIKDDKL